MARTNPSLTDVLDAAKRLKRPIGSGQAKLLAAYLDQLIKWNRKMNLVGPADWRTVFNTLVVDSLYLASFLKKCRLPDTPLTLDLGAGAGLPGIPLRTIWQDGEYYLVEVREKRSLFMRSVVGKLKLPGTHVFHGRAEDVLEGIDQTVADLILSRAFMPWPKLLDFVRPMLREGGALVILSNDPPPDMADLPAGWVLENHSKYPAADSERFFWALRNSSS